jgi:CRISPR-associated protein Csd2
MFISRGASLNSRLAALPKSKEARAEALLATYLDARVFGAVANTGGSGVGVVHGPVQVHDSVSINVPVVELAGLIRCVATKEDENHTMGSRYKVPYVAMRGTVQISANRAQKAKMTEADERVFIESLLTMFHDHASNSSGIQRMRKVFLFESESPSIDVGIAVDAVKTSVKEGVEIVTSFDDIEVSLIKEKIPRGTKVTELM